MKQYVSDELRGLRQQHKGLTIRKFDVYGTRSFYRQIFQELISVGVVNFCPNEN